jgi:predicted  nucleic acid-binding Zn-ribbon protein
MDIRNIFGNGDRDNTSLDSSLQDIKDKYDALEKLLADRDQEIASLKAQIEALMAGQSTTPTPEVVATEDTPKEQAPTPTPEAPSAELLAALTAAIADLKAQHEDLKAASADIKEHVTYRSTLIKQDIGECDIVRNLFAIHFDDVIRGTYSILRHHVQGVRILIINLCDSLEIVVR